MNLTKQEAAEFKRLRRNARRRLDGDGSVELALDLLMEFAKRHNLRTTHRPHFEYLCGWEQVTK